MALFSIFICFVPDTDEVHFPRIQINTRIATRVARLYFILSSDFMHCIELSSRVATTGEALAHEWDSQQSHGGGRTIYVQVITSTVAVLLMSS